MDKKSPFDVVSLRLDPNLVGVPKQRKRRPTRYDRFLAGPIPMWWIAEAGKLHGKALLVGTVLWHLKGLNKKWTIALSNIEAEQWGITRQSKRRALAALSDAGLIAIENFRSRSPQITLLDKKPAIDA